jgi:GNAT superfamily N-acetyltransferase
MQGVEVRVADDHDVAALAALRAAWVAERRPVAGEGFEDEFRAWFETEAGHRVFWLATVGGTAVGMVNLMLFDRMPTPGGPSGGWGYLGNMFVLGSHRDAGVGSVLIDALLAWADEHGLERVVLNPTDRSIPFYRRKGFAEATELMLRHRPER